jgi:hypothetical protein
MITVVKSDIRKMTGLAGSPWIAPKLEGRAEAPSWSLTESVD